MVRTWAAKCLILSTVAAAAALGCAVSSNSSSLALVETSGNQPALGPWPLVQERVALVMAWDLANPAIRAELERAGLRKSWSEPGLSRYVLRGAFEPDLLVEARPQGDHTIVVITRSADGAGRSAMQVARIKKRLLHLSGQRTEAPPATPASSAAPASSSVPVLPANPHVAK